MMLKDAEMTNVKRRTVRRGRLDCDQMLVTIGFGAKEQRYALMGMSRMVIDYLTLLGLKTALLTGDDCPGAYEALRSGVLPEPRPRKPQRRSQWRVALAHALAYIAAQQRSPRNTKRSVLEQVAAEELPALLAHVKTLPRENIRRARERPDVQDWYRRLFGSKSETQSSLFELAGLNPPLFDEVTNAHPTTTRPLPPRTHSQNAAA